MTLPTALPLDERRVAAATLACLPGINPSRLWALLDRWPDPLEAASAVRAGRAGEALRRGGPAADPEPLLALARRWASAIDQRAIRSLLERRATTVLLASDASFPFPEGVPGRPAVLFLEGSTEALAGPRVAVVGTRSASPGGLADAAELGAFLARAGIAVVSGLALGIDGAAHRGALDGGGRCVGVVATGLDVVYPRRHAVLHQRVRDGGALLAESAFGTGPHPARFPVRNRILAALADVVVVVEATVSGGARITAERAIEYDRPLLVVPGSRRNPAAAGCNALLADGAHPLLDPADVLVALGLTPGSRRGWAAGRPAALPPHAQRVATALAGDPATDDELVERTGLSLGEVAMAVAELERLGRAERSRGFVWAR